MSTTIYREEISRLSYSQPSIAAMCEGYQAYCDGKPRSGWNLYREGSLLYSRWIGGWYDAQKAGEDYVKIRGGWR